MAQKNQTTNKKFLKPLNSSLYNIESSFGKQHSNNTLTTSRSSEKSRDVLSLEKFSPTLPNKEIAKNPYFLKTIIR